MLRTSGFGLALVVLAAVSFSTTVSAEEPSNSQIQWHNNLKTAHQVSTQTNKPMLVMFDASWCGYCRKMKQQTLSDPKMIRYVNETFVPVSLNFDRDKRVAEILNVQSIPCTVVLSPDVDLLARVVGYTETSALHTKLESARALQARLQQTKLSSAKQPSVQ